MSKPINKSDVKWQGNTYNFEVFDDKDFSKFKDVKQVSGFIFNDKDEMLIVKCGPNKDWCLPGGGPEKVDKTWKDTLTRELEEEADVEVENIKPAGYVRVTTPDKNIPGKRKLGIMLRASAKVTKVKPQTIDPCTGVINERKFVPIKDFLKYCPWGENGKAQLELARKAMGIKRKIEGFFSTNP